MNTEYSFLCGYSYAWQVCYKPKAFSSIEKVLLAEEIDPDYEIPTIRILNRRLVEQIIDSYGKLGFLFLSRDYISKINGKHPLAHIYVSYHLYNFIYDCKAFLDAVAVMLNDFYKIGKRRGYIDFKIKLFRNETMKKEPKLEEIIRKLEEWFETVADWRDKLIHRFSIIVAPSGSGNHTPTKAELDQLSLKPCMMLVEPQPMFTGSLKKLKRKYGKENISRRIEPFCEDWIAKACNFYDEVCEVISLALK